MLKVRTLSPVRSPISADSERRAADTLKQMAEAGSNAGGLVNLLAETDTLTSFEWPWANGYGTLEHDNLPAFFQPFACYSVAMDDVSLPFEISELLGNNGGAIECCRLYLYDDTVALLQLDVTFETSESALVICSKGIAWTARFPIWPNGSMSTRYTLRFTSTHLDSARAGDTKPPARSRTFEIRRSLRCFGMFRSIRRKRQTPMCCGQGDTW